ncbi:hypothetical protein J7F01_41250 [Streptomyces sp. ISL-22]|uniref:hypothetical protein n=1 Tax=unclassified Streptomyces TaxID=2593676 RepID=UPI001BE6220E|nr:MULTISPECIES: hypothetical protein [unclassified Streptomyces]MBT2423439.1 hypothetical protein [Streptomyces sp. ISL-24]MBT2438418.1 hypothetical protein [Streptomyces sp. ISL-22]
MNIRPRRTLWSAAYGAAAIGLAAAGVVVQAPSASASSDRYIAFTNDAGYLIDTCYTWKGSEGIESKNYCHRARPIGTSWKAYFPAEAEGATVTVNFTGSHSVPVYLNETDTDHCFRLTGAWPNGHLLKVEC